MDKADLEQFKTCEICGEERGKIDYDSPLYCDKCIAEMEKLSLGPERYKEYRELKDTLKK